MDNKLKLTKDSIRICGIHDVPSLIIETGATNVISLLDPRYLPMELRVPLKNHLQIPISDTINQNESHAPNPKHIEMLLKQGVPMLLNSVKIGKPLIVHCYAGISRSTAAAFTLLCAVAGPGHEQTLIEWILSTRHIADPNGLIVKHADDVLGRNGAMVKALSSMDEEIVRRFRIRAGIDD